MTFCNCWRIQIIKLDRCNLNGSLNTSQCSESNMDYFRSVFPTVVFDVNISSTKDGETQHHQTCNLTEASILKCNISYMYDI